MWRRPACQALSKAYDIASARARIAPDLLKALAILSETTVRRSAINWKDQRPYRKSEKGPHFCRWSASLLFTSSFFKDFFNNRKTNMVVDLFPSFLNTGTINKTFQQSWKQDSLRQILKNSASMYEISGSHFFRTTGIQSEPDAFD